MFSFLLSDIPRPKYPKVWVEGPGVNAKYWDKSVDEAVALAAKISGTNPKELKVHCHNGLGKYVPCWHTKEVLNG